jgi:hypothetical protein
MKQRTATGLGLGLALAALILVVSLGSVVAQEGTVAALRGGPAGQERNREPAQTGDYDLSWWTVDGGGRTGGSETHPYALGGTSGQPDAAIWTSNGYTLAGGFWGGVVVEYRIFLPLVLRGA